MYQQLFKLEEEVLKVMANQKRLEIIQLLNHKELSVSEMVAMLGIPQANLSQHLSVLRQSSLVKIRRHGQRIYYSLADKNIAKAADIIYRFLEKRERMDIPVSKKAGEIYPIVRDPVCGMRVSVHEAFTHAQYAGKTYFFCAGGCAKKFASRPKVFAMQMAGVKA